MFEIGELMVYGTSGVCRVKDICPSPFNRDGGTDKLFYQLEPLNDTSNYVIYSPVDNTAVRMRRLLPLERIREIIDSLSDVEIIEVPVEKRRRDVYRDTLQTADTWEYLRLIKTVARRRAEFRRTRRRLPDIDNDSEHTARKCVYDEFSAVLGICRDEVNSLLISRLE